MRLAAEFAPRSLRGIQRQAHSFELADEGDSGSSFARRGCDFMASYLQAGRTEPSGGR